jgi:hypothetical protein
MCRSQDEGGRRCPDSRALRALTAADLAPPTPKGVPPIEWATTTDVTALWDDSGPEVACATLHAITTVRDIEPKATSDIRALAADVGGRAADLEFRMKSPASLARKITTKQATAFGQGREISAESVVAGLGDTLRYTVAVTDHDSIADAARLTVRQLQEHGWEISEIESTYVSGNPYKGLHIIGKPPGGPQTEVQVHSELSLAAKTDTHLDYEISRDLNAPASERLAADARMRARQDQVPMPTGIDTLDEIDGLPVRKKAYPRR